MCVHVIFHRDSVLIACGEEMVLFTPKLPLLDPHWVNWQAEAKYVFSPLRLILSTQAPLSAAMKSEATVFTAEEVQVHQFSARWLCQRAQWEHLNAAGPQMSSSEQDGFDLSDSVPLLTDRQW